MERGTRTYVYACAIQYAWPPPTTSWRVLRTRLAKLNLAKILPQYKGWAIGENFILQIFLSYTVFPAEARYLKQTRKFSYMHMYLVLSLLLYTIPPSKSLGSICLGPMLCQVCLVVPANGTLHKVTNVYYNTTYSMLLVISMLVSSSYSNSSVSCVSPGEKQLRDQNKCLGAVPKIW